MEKKLIRELILHISVKPMSQKSEPVRTYTLIHDVKVEEDMVTFLLNATCTSSAN